MNIQAKKQTRVEELIDKLKANETLINNAGKGAVEINFAGESMTVTIKIVV